MFANVNGIQIAYTDEGEGLPLLFIHGFPLNRGVWSSQVEAFKFRHRVIALDLRGFGESRASAGPVSMSHFADDIWSLLQQLGVGPVILAGHAMGGYIALAFAKAYPKLLRGLVLVGTKAGTDSAEEVYNLRATAEKVRLGGTSVVVEAMAPRMLSASNKDELLAASIRRFMATASPEGVRSALLGMAERPDAGGWLEKIRVPTLEIVGSEDTVISPIESETLAKSIPEAQLRVIPDAGHLVALEQPKAFNEAMRDWLAWGCEGVKHTYSQLHHPLRTSPFASPSRHPPL
jgi:pimeloyl-ACP methyl ester carboxylesterase